MARATGALSQLHRKELWSGGVEHGPAQKKKKSDEITSADRITVDGVS